MDNCLIATKRLLGSFQVSYTQRFLKEKILTHPQYPSLLSIADALEEYGLESLAVKLGSDRLDEIPLPAIVQVSLSGGIYFFTITAVSENLVSLFDEKGNKKDLPRTDFLKIWTGMSLLVEPSGERTEPEIKQKIKDKSVLTGILSLFLLVCLLWWGSGFLAGLNYWNDQSEGGTFVLYFLAKLCGLVVAGVLLWYQVDKENPTLQRVCAAGKKVDCEVVLKSKAFQLLGGIITPSLLAFAYFLAGIGTLISFPATSMTLLAGLSLVTIPIILYSLYYQARIIKKWCRFCLLIKCLLILEVLAVMSGAFWLGGIHLSSTSLFLLLFFGVIILGFFIMPLIGKEDEVFRAKRNLAKLKSNKTLFELALTRSRGINTEPIGIGILMKGNKSKYKIIKVCNPYCGPCSLVHPVLENLFERGNIDLQIIFTPEREDDLKGKAIRHLLAIDSIGNPELTRKALDDWYEEGYKDYDSFASMYKMNGELKKQEERVEKMREWCQSESIAYTPTLFINGFELPEEYSVEDLKYILD